MAIVDIALFTVRLILGTFFLKHGCKKLLNPKDMAQWLDKLGYKPGIFWSWMIILAELGGGLAVILGIFVRPFALMMSVIMILGIYHRKFVKKLNFIEGWEINYVTLGLILTLILLGAGAISLGVYIDLPALLK